MRDIRESSAGQSLSAWVILNRKGEHVATVQAHYANSGGVTVNVRNHGDAACYAYTVASLQVGRAGGYGYDKTTAALSGLYVDGVKLTNHCEERLPRPKGCLWQDSDRARIERKGYRLANWHGPRKAGDPTYGRDGVPDEASGWTDAYRESGLDILRAFGYRVIQAI